jgi:hypothetical protein
VAKRLGYELLVNKKEYDKNAIASSGSTYTFADYAIDFLSHKYGLRSLSEGHLIDLLMSVRQYYAASKRIKILDLFIGAVAPRDDGRPIFGQAAMDTMVETFASMKSRNMIRSEGFTAEYTDYVEISRTKAKAVMKEVFGYVSLPILSLMMVQVSLLPTPKSGRPTYINLDDFLGVVCVSYASERLRWTQRIQDCFEKFSVRLTAQEEVLPVFDGDEMGLDVENDTQSVLWARREHAKKHGLALQRAFMDPEDRPGAA